MPCGTLSLTGLVYVRFCLARLRSYLLAGVRVVARGVR